MGKCTKSCSRKQTINSLNKEIVQKDSVIFVYEDSIKYLNVANTNLSEQLSNEINHSSNLTGVATTNIKNQTVKLDSLTHENRLLKAENIKLRKEIKQLQEEVDEIMKQLP